MDWFEWHPLRYRVKTRHLTAEQDGIYRRLIDEYMETRQPLPDNDFALAAIARVPNDCFSSASSIIRAFFKPRGGFLYNETCDELLDDQDQSAKFRSERARKGALARHGLSNENKDVSATSNANAMLKPAKETITKRIRKKEKEDIPPDGFDRFWQAYPRSENKSEAHKAFVKALKGTDHETIIRGATAFADHCKREGTEKRFIAHASTWLNQRRWENDYSSMGTGPNGQRVHVAAPRRGLDALEAAADNLFSQAGGFVD
jgi:uncharacterized protein YdaU (DUF1376 family)